MTESKFAADASTYINALLEWAMSALPQFIAAVLMLVAGLWLSGWAARAVGRFVDTNRAIDWAYQEILTRLPTPDEKTEARAILGDAPSEGMADLRWALLNSHEFRFLP